MKKIRVNLVTVSVVIALVALLVVEGIQTIQLYEKKESELDSKLSIVMDKVALRYEKIEHLNQYMEVVNKNFENNYKKIIIEEFQNLLGITDSIVLNDTIIIENGEEIKYMTLSGKIYDSVKLETTNQKWISKKLTKIDELIEKPAQSISGFKILINQPIIQKIYREAQYVNEMIHNVILSNIYHDPLLNLNLKLFDSIIKDELKQENIDYDYSFLLTDQNNKVIHFDVVPKPYNKKLNLIENIHTNLYPGSIFEDRIFFYLGFNQKDKILYNQMKLPFLTGFILVLLIITSLIYLFKTILTQKKLFEIKNDFISNMTHEFKTPISTISLACQALEDKDMMGTDSVMAKPMVEMIVKENAKLETLVEQILQSAALDKGEAQVHKENVILNEEVYNAAEDAKFRINHLNGKINVILPNEMLNLQLDRIHLANVLKNLLDNAIKYSGLAPDIEIELKRLGKFYQISVKDSGIGMKKEHLKRIFDKLYRIPTGNRHDVKGFGLGLSYVQSICELHDWQITVESEWKVGTEFILKINNNI